MSETKCKHGVSRSGCGICDLKEEEAAPTPQPVQQAEPKQSVQNFQWDGSTPRMDGTMVWFRSIDGSEHGWPQLTDHEAMRLVLFLHGSKQRASESARTEGGKW